MYNPLAELYYSIVLPAFKLQTCITLTHLIFTTPEKRYDAVAAVHRPTSPPQIRRPETLRHTPQTGPLRLQVRRPCLHRPRHRRQHQVHRPQCRRALRHPRLRFVHQPRLL